MTESILNSLIEKLKKERDLIIQAISDKNKVKELENVIKEKENLLKELATIPPEELSKHKEKVEDIKKLSKINMNLALDNMEFIEDIFSSIFEDEAQKYNQKGYIQQEQKSLFNKKI